MMIYIGLLIAWSLLCSATIQFPLDQDQHINPEEIKNPGLVHILPPSHQTNTNQLGRGDKDQFTDVYPKDNLHTSPWDQDQHINPSAIKNPGLIHILPNSHQASTNHLGRGNKDQFSNVYSQGSQYKSPWANDPVAIKKPGLLHIPPSSHQSSTNQLRWKQADQFSDIYPQGSQHLSPQNKNEKTIQYPYVGQINRHDFATTQEFSNSPIIRNYQVWVPNGNVQNLHHPPFNSYVFMPMDGSQPKNIPVIPIPVYGYQYNTHDSRKLQGMAQRQQIIFPGVVYVKGQEGTQGGENYVPVIKYQPHIVNDDRSKNTVPNIPKHNFLNRNGHRPHVGITKGGSNNAIPNTPEPNSEESDYDEEEDLSSRFGGEDNDGISAWGDNAGSSHSTGSSEIEHFSTTSGKKPHEGKSLLRRIRDLSPYGVNDYTPVGTHTNYGPQTGGRYDVWDADEALIDISTLQSDKLPPGYYNYPKLNTDQDDENEGSHHRAMGFRPMEHFSPPDRDISINVLDRHPQEFYEYSIKPR